MKLAAIAIALLFVWITIPGASASGGACDTTSFALGTGGNPDVLTTTSCAPIHAEVGETFWVTAYAQLTIGGVLLALEPSTSWSYDGCSRVSSTVRDSTLTQSERVLVSMSEPTCTIVGYVTEGLITALIIPLHFSIYDPTANLPTEFSNNVEITAWPDVLNVSADVTAAITSWPELFASVEITAWPELAGALGVEITAWPELFASVEITEIPEIVATIQAWPELFASVEITAWPTLLAFLSGGLDITGVTIDVGNLTIENLTAEAPELAETFAVPTILLLIILTAFLLSVRQYHARVLSLVIAVALFVLVVAGSASGFLSGAIVAPLVIATITLAIFAGIVFYLEHRPGGDSNRDLEV